MCGRFALGIPRKRLAEYFRTANEPGLPERWNIAPGQPLEAVVPGHGDRVFRTFTWGLVPAWARDPAAGPRPINIRSETAAAKPAFKGLLRRRRCLVPAQGFYEWRATPRGKEPFFIARADGAPLGLAGLWDRWAGDGGEELFTCAILTTRANGLVAPIHERMPVIVDPAGFDPWLDAGDPDTAGPGAMLRPYPDGLLRAWGVSPRVNRTGTDGPDLVLPAEPEEVPPLLRVTAPRPRKKPAPAP